MLEGTRVDSGQRGWDFDVGNFGILKRAQRPVVLGRVRVQLSSEASEAVIQDYRPQRGREEGRSFIYEKYGLGEGQCAEVAWAVHERARVSVHERSGDGYLVLGVYRLDKG